MEVISYTSSSGTDYFDEFLGGVPPKAVKKILRQLELVEKFGFNFVTHAGTMKKLHGYDVYEIIIDFDRVNYRIFCVIRNVTCWLLHAFIKKSNSTPVREIMTALKRAKDLDLQLAMAVR